MWKPENINLGRIRVGSKHTLKYRFEGDIEIEKLPTKALSIFPSCGCSSAIWDDLNKTLSVTYKAGGIPEHMSRDGITSYNADKNITVFRTVNGERVTDFLTFKAHVYEA